jgi:hypothetical protein
MPRCACDQRIIVEHNVFGVHFLEGDAQPDVDAARRQHPHRRGAELLPHFGHHLLGQIQQHELDVGGVESHLFGRRIGERSQLRGQLGSRVGRADDHDGPACGRPAGIVIDVGQLGR